MPTAASHRGSLRGDIGVLGTASIANGLLSYVYVAIGTRAYGAAEFAPLSVVWSLWALGIAVMAFPFQHRVILLRETGVEAEALRRDRLRLAATGLVGSALLAAGLVPFRQLLFGDEALAWPLIAGAVVLSSAWLGITRGDLAGSGRPRAAAAILVLEQVVRVVVGVVVVVLGAGVVGYGWSMLAAFVLVVGWRVAPVDDEASRVPSGLGRYLVAVAGGSLFGQLVLTGSPVLLSAIGGRPADVTALFTTLAVARAPYLVGLGAAIRTMGDFGRVVARHGAAGLRSQVALVLRWGLVAVVVVTPLAGWIGPWFLRLVFGADAALSGPATAMVAAGALLATASLLLLLVQIATGDVASILLARTLGVGLFVVVAVVAWTDPLTRVVVGFLASEVAAFVGLGTAAWRSTRAERSEPRSGVAGDVS